MEPAARTMMAGLGLAALLILACAGPFYERAAVTPGLSGGGGVGLTAGERMMMGYDDFPITVRDLSLLGSGYIRYGLSDRTSIFAQATAGYGAWNHEALAHATPAALALSLTDIQLGAKFRLGGNGALKASLGLPSVVDVAYLHDFGRYITTNVGIGLRGASLGLTNHLYLAPGVVQHISLTATVFPSPFSNTNRHLIGGAFFGISWEFMKPPREE
jgi:hypothetical protein